jgi:uncharacterized DUF497 family protein
MALTFEWDANKARRNLAKHGIGFEEAFTVFGDPRSLTISDPVHSGVEDRFVTLGMSHRGKLLGCRAHGTSRQYPHHQRATGEQTRTTEL